MLDIPIRKGQATRDRLDFANRRCSRRIRRDLDRRLIAAGASPERLLLPLQGQGGAREGADPPLPRTRQRLLTTCSGAGQLHDDPLHGLVGLKLFAEMMANLPEAHPGCLAASFAYQDQIVTREIRALNASGLMAWRRRFHERLLLIAERYPPRPGVDLEALADMATSTVEGGMIVGRALRDATILPRQVLLYRDYVRTVFPHSAAAVTELRVAA
jgi:hypothetical protein